MRMFERQSIGLVDWDGKDIHEGDILRNVECYVTSGQYDFTVTYTVGKFMGVSDVVDIEPEDFEYCRIVGSIYEKRKS